MPAIRLSVLCSNSTIHQIELIIGCSWVPLHPPPPDLVPREVVEAWLRYFRNEYPCIAFKAATVTGKGHRVEGGLTNVHSLQFSDPCSPTQGSVASSFDAASDKELSGSNCVGSDVLLQVNITGKVNDGLSLAWWCGRLWIKTYNIVYSYSLIEWGEITFQEWPSPPPPRFFFFKAFS